MQWYLQWPNDLVPSAHKFLAEVTLDRLRGEMGLDDDWHVRFMKKCGMCDSDLWINAPSTDPAIWGWCPYKSRTIYLSIDIPLDRVKAITCHEIRHAVRQQEDDEIPSPASLAREEGEAEHWERLADRLPWEYRS